MTEVMQWNGSERRTGDERRVRIEHWATDRRQAERRRGGMGTHHPDPTEALLAGMDVPQTLAFEPRADAEADAAARKSMAQPITDTLAGAARGLAPAHAPHDAIPSTAAIGGHPLHPAVVPLPIGAFTGALAADLAYAATRDPFFARAARLLTGAGLATGALAGILGGIDFWTKGQVRSHRAAWLHAGGNAATLALGAASMAIRSRGGARGERRGVLPAGLVLSLLAASMLLLTGWLGGELSYRHRMGVTDRESGA